MLFIFGEAILMGALSRAVAVALSLPPLARPIAAMRSMCFVISMGAMGDLRSLFPYLMNDGCFANLLRGKRWPPPRRSQTSSAVGGRQRQRSHRELANGQRLEPAATDDRHAVTTTQPPHQ
eukprot:6452968-Pyramimonas_sp.AAC.1